MLSARPVSAHYRDNLHNENTHRFGGSKTPGRALKGRSGLQENIVHNGYSTADPKEKRHGAKTPFRPDFVHDLSSIKPQATLAPRPLIDKTPLPNRQARDAFHTPLTNAGKLNKLPLPALIDEQEDHTTPPPSSSRKKLRIPRTSLKFLQTTPITKGDHWNVSDISIELANSSLGDVVEEEVDEPDYSEPEYMPPTAVDQPYIPPFDVPNYGETGVNLMKVARSYVVEPERQHPLELDATFNDSAIWTETFKSGLKLSSLDDDDPFTVASKNVKRLRTKTTNAGAAQSNVRTRSMAKSKACEAPSTNQPSQPRRRPITSMQIRRTVTPKSSNSSSFTRPATALSTKTSTLRRVNTAGPPSKGIAVHDVNSEKAVLQFGDDGPIVSDFRFSL